MMISKTHIRSFTRILAKAMVAVYPSIKTVPRYELFEERTLTRHPKETSVLELVSESIRKRAKALGEEFRRAQPFPHLVLDHFLDPEFCQELIAAFPPFEREHALNEYGQAGLKAVVPQLRRIGPPYARLDTLLSSSAFLSLVSDLTGI